MDTNKYSKELDVAIEAALKAGGEIMRIRETKELQVQVKEDATLVTLADKTSNELICKELMENFPTYGLLTEEKMEDPLSFQKAIEEWHLFEKTWVIDPLDGTKNFSRNGHDFGIHIGLIENGIPVLGVNYYPVQDTVFFAVKGMGAYKKIGSSEPERLLIDPETTVIHPIFSNSESRIGAIYDKLKPSNKSKVTIHSCGLRICSIAEGIYNLYIYEGLRAGLWDFCSGDVIVTEAGGYMSDWNGNPIDYRNKNAKLEHGVVVCGSKALIDKTLQLLK